MRVFAAGAAIGVLVAAGVASGGYSASRVVDRTVVCRPAGGGYPDPFRIIDVGATPRIGEHSPSASVNNGFRAEGVTAGFYTGPYYGHPTGAVWLNRTQCTESSLRVPLSSTGLRGGQARWNQQHKCDVPAKILVRIRAVFTRPVSLSRDPRVAYQLVAKGRITTASLAVTTLQRKPIVFASADDATGKARLFTSGARCRPD